MELKQDRTYTEAEYEKLNHNGLVEYNDGHIILQAAPSRRHQKIIGQLHNEIYNYLKGKNCEVYTSPFNVRLNIQGNIKRVEPDISVICDKNKLNDKGCEGSPDFIIEVISETNKMHDYVTKVQWYKMYGVREYWIVNYKDRIVTVYSFECDEVNQYTFNQSVSIGIWEDFKIDFNLLDLS